VTAEATVCRNGAACVQPGCQFPHPGRDERPAPTEERVCVWFRKNKCRNGDDCEFQHIQEDRDANVIVVRKLPKEADPSVLQMDILWHFQNFGHVWRVQVKTDLDGRCRGFAFVICGDVAHADRALEHGHPVWDVRRKTDLPMYIEGDDRASRKTNAVLARTDAPLRLPFSVADRTLFVGEGDFSYTAAAFALRRLEPSCTIATSKDPPRTDVHLVKLRQAGVDCRIGIDATRSTNDWSIPSRLESSADMDTRT